ncbi:MAG: VCBS repeat-containing protein [Hyphomicrobiaceae bacterium]
MKFHDRKSATAAILVIVSSLTLSPPAQAESLPRALADHRPVTGNKNIKRAWLADATTRYQHYVLGSTYEAATIIADLSDGRCITLTLPADSVFEDRQPRLADLDGDGRDEIILVRSYLKRGAALVVIGIVNDEFKIIAETPPTGSPNTWLNPAGIADFDGDGRMDIAYVQMPHVLGKLRLWTLKSGALVEIATLTDTSNHVAGSNQLGLSVVADFDGDGIADLAIPSRDRMSLRFLTFKGGVRELKRAPLPLAATSDFKFARQHGKAIVSVGHGAGRSTMVAY